MKKNLLLVASLSIFIFLAAPCQAQSYQFDYTSLTPFQETSLKNIDGLQETLIDTIYRNPLNQSNAQMRNGLPPVTTDSFVYEAGGMAESIYGDEGVNQISPFFEFTSDHRIEAGISGNRAKGLTTGHSSALPSTWGGDEFYMPEPWRVIDSSTGISMPILPESN